MFSVANDHVMRRVAEASRATAKRHVFRHYSRIGSDGTAGTTSNAVIGSIQLKPPEQPQGPLSGLRIAVKDNIVTASTSGLPTTAASRILSSHRSPFEATVVRLLRQHGAIVDAKTNLDEFGMGSHSQNSAFGPVKSLYGEQDCPLSPGGSSGGSAVTVAVGGHQAALGTDTGGSVRLPAAYTGIVGFKPSYGLLSRWGVIQYANSLDTVGILACNMDHIETIFRLLNCFDAQDPTSLSESIRQRIHNAATCSTTVLRIGVPLDYCIAELSNTVREAYIATLNDLQSAGHQLVPVSLPRTRQALSAYYVLAPAEASSNLAKYDGIRYGQRRSGGPSPRTQTLPLYARTRSAGFGQEVKRRIVLGAYTLSSEAMDNYFIQAQKVRRLVQQDFDHVFSRPNPLTQHAGADNHNRVDILVTPTAPTEAPKIEQVQQQTPVETYMNDVFTVPASLAGLPALSVPASSGGGAMPRMIGIQVVGQFGDDDLVLRLGRQIERRNSSEMMST